MTDYPVRRRAGFTLIELLVVIAIIAILAAILFPVFAQARESARQTACLSNGKQIGLGLSMYQQDYDETLPAPDWNGKAGFQPPPFTVFASADGAGVSGPTWADVFQPYVKNVQIMKCPSDGTGNPIKNGKTVPGVPLSYALNFYFYSTTAGARFSGPYVTLAEIQRPASKIFITEVSSSLNQELVRPDRWKDGLRRHRDGSNYVLVDGHAKWHRLPPTWYDDKAPGYIAPAVWSAPAQAEKTPYKQWFFWIDEEEKW